MILEANNYTVYKHTSPVGKVYIGITKMNPVRRWANGLGYKKRNISKSLIGNKRAARLTCNRKAVLQYSLDGRLLATYSHSAKAAEIIGCDKSGINRACRENNNEHIENTKYKGIYKGFRWYYNY